MRTPQSMQSVPNAQKLRPSEPGPPSSQTPLPIRERSLHKSVHFPGGGEGGLGGDGGGGGAAGLGGGKGDITTSRLMRRRTVFGALISSKSVGSPACRKLVCALARLLRRAFAASALATLPESALVSYVQATALGVKSMTPGSLGGGGGHAAVRLTPFQVMWPTTWLTNCVGVAM